VHQGQRLSIKIRFSQSLIKAYTISFSS
jgi:hypothetical protein